MAEQSKADELTARLLGAMYDPGAKGAPRGRPFGAPLQQKGKSVSVTLGGQTVDVPSMAYVADLERQIAEQQAVIQRMQSTLETTRAYIRRLSTEINSKIAGIGSDLDRKIDGRF